MSDLSNSSAFDPYVIQRLMQSLQMEVDPFLDQRDTGAYNWTLPPADADDIGTLDHQNRALTAMDKANSMTMDPAFLFSLGTSAGAPGPGAYLPNTRYQPIQAQVGK